MPDPTLARSRSFYLIGLACASAFVSALALSMVVSRFAPLIEPERLVAGALSFPCLWLGMTLFLLFGGWRRHLVVAASTAGLIALMLLV